MRKPESKSVQEQNKIAKQQAPVITANAILQYIHDVFSGKIQERKQRKQRDKKARESTP